MRTNSESILCAPTKSHKITAVGNKEPQFFFFSYYEEADSRLGLREIMDSTLCIASPVQINNYTSLFSY